MGLRVSEHGGTSLSTIKNLGKDSKYIIYPHPFTLFYHGFNHLDTTQITLRHSFQSLISSKIDTTESPKGFHGLITQPSPSLVGEAYLRGEGWEELTTVTSYPEGVAL